MKVNLKETIVDYDNLPTKVKNHISRNVLSKIGTTINKFVILEYLYSTTKDKSNFNHYYKCKCECGNIIIASYKRLFNKYRPKKDCGCGRDILAKKNREKYIERIKKEYIGKIYNRLTIIDYENYEIIIVGKDKREVYEYYVTCKCKCGNIVKHVNLHRLRNGQVKSCGCALKGINSLKDVNDIIGTRQGKVVVLKYIGMDHNDEYNRNNYYYKCKCDCGTEFIARRDRLISKNHQSCGCDTVYNKEYESTSRFANIHHIMMYRCYNPNCASYERYGAKGVTVCERWKESYQNFKEDMYDEYVKHAEEHGEKNTTLDRYDNTKGYSPDNCHWVTYEEQNNNKSSNRYIDVFGEKLTIANAVRKYGANNVSYKLVRNRISNNIDPLIALHAPSGKLTEFANTIYEPIEFFNPDNPPQEYLDAKKETRRE